MTNTPDRSVRLGPGAEFDLIRRFVGARPELPDSVLVGPGDDAAVLEGGWVISSDLSVEDVHFRRAWLSDAEIGHRAAAAALSDLAAMAATPVALLLSVAAPASVDLEALAASVRAVARSVGASVAGGDLSRSPGPLVLDVVAIGRTERPVLRNGVRPGDEVWVTGSLGASAAAVLAWRSGGEPSVELRAAFARPVARVAEALGLVERGVARAMIDLSDGLAGDAGHLAAASGVCVTLEAAHVPVSGAAVEALGEAAALEAALHGGEDYELCFAARRDAVDPAAFAERHGTTLTRVGTAAEGQGVRLEERDGSTRTLERGGYDHWAGGGS